MLTFTSFAPLALLLSTVYSVNAAITPTTPDGATVVRVGGTLSTAWTADMNGTWQNTQIQLMTGDNYQMVPLKTLATGIDGTTTTTFSAPCPDVSPYSKIYFLQFTRGGDVSTATWTTRFTIAGADGSTTPPTNTTNYSGTDVQWGTGVLVGESSDSGNTTTSNSNSTAPAGIAGTNGTAATPASSSKTGVTLYQPSTSSGPSATPLVAAASSASASVSRSVSSVSSAGAATAASASQSRSVADAALSVGMGAGAGVGVLGMLMTVLL